MEEYNKPVDAYLLKGNTKSEFEKCYFKFEGNECEKST